MSLRVLRFFVVSSAVLCASRGLAQELPPSAATERALSVTPPRLIRAEPVLLPDAEMKAEAVPVTLALTIDETGHVLESAILESGGERFDQSALAAVKQFEFEPARRNGVPVAAKIRYRYVFPAASAPAAAGATGGAPPEAASAPPVSAPIEAPNTTTAGALDEFSAVATVEAPPREPTRRSISGEVLTEMPGTRGDALRSIEVLPGVGRTSLNNGDPILRGAGQDESQSYLNGVPVPFLYHFGGLTSFSKLADSARQNLSVTVGHLAASQQIGPLEQVISGTELHARSEWRVELLPELNATFGADFYGQFLGGRYHGPAPDQYEGNPSDQGSLLTRRTVSTVLPSFSVVRPGAYLEFGLRPARRLLLVPGVRADYYGDVNHSSLDPRLSARYEVSHALTFKSGVGYYSQAPQYWQALAVVGNPRIEPYRALQTSLGFEGRVADTLKFGAEGFYKRLEHRIVGTKGGVEPLFVNDGEGRIYGVELSTEYRPAPGSYAYVAYTLSRSERQDGDGPYRLFDHDQPHILSLAAGQNLGRGWSVGGRFRFISGDPTTAVVGSVFNHARHHVRAAARRRRAMSAYGDTGSPDSSDPEREARRKELAALLTRALDTLPVDQRVAFVLCEVEERSSREASEIVGAPEATLRTRLFHAKKKLRLALETEGLR